MILQFFDLLDTVVKLLSRKWVEFKYPYAEKFDCNNIEEYSELYEWLQTTSNNVRKDIWIVGTKQQVLDNGLSIIKFNGEIRFKDKAQAVAYKLRYWD